MELRILPREHVLTAWAEIEPLLARIVGKDGREDLLDVAGCLLKGEYTAFIAVEGAPKAVCIVQITQNRHAKLATIVYVAGNDLTEWVDLLDIVVNWCKAQGCNLVEGTGRRGWERILKPKQFALVSTTIRKQL